MDSERSSAGASRYKQSPARVKTLDILAKTTPLQEQSVKNLIKYCELAREECGEAATMTDGIQFLAARYEWDVDSRESDFKEAWLASESPLKPKTSVSKELGNSVDIDVMSENTIDSNRIYLTLKKDSFTKNTLLCQVNDPGLQVLGDTGAIGRLTTSGDKKSITVDLKGRQYTGQLYPGPTVMFMNTSQIGAKTSSSDNKVTAKIETFTNEFCHLKFDRDLMIDLVGTYSGDMEYIRGQDDSAMDANLRTPSSTRKRKGKNEDDEGSDEEQSTSKRKVKSKNNNPKISTITQKVKKGKGPTKKRKSTKNELSENGKAQRNRGMWAPIAKKILSSKC